MKIFLGYASERLEEATEIYQFLKSINEDVWFDKKSLTGGDEWDRERLTAQSAADFIIHLVSPEIFLRAGVVNREIRQTLKQVEDQPFGSTYALFVRLEEIRLPAEFIRFQYIDFFRQDWREQLTLAVAKRRNQLGGAVLRVASDRTVTVQNESETVGSSIRSSKIETSSSSEHYTATAEYLQYSGGNVYWDFVNARIASEALGGFIDALSDFKKMDDDDKIRVLTFEAPFEWTINMQEFFRRDDIVSIRSSLFWYGGGAHPSHAITTLNFLGADYGFCTIGDLLSHDNGNALKMISYCKKVLLATFDGEELDDFIESSFDDPKNTWSLARHYSIDDRGVTINFSPYDVLPYAFGSHEVLVPWRFMEPMIDAKYLPVIEKLTA